VYLKAIYEFCGTANSKNGVKIRLMVILCEIDCMRVTLCENGGGLADISKNSRVFQDYMGES